MDGQASPGHAFGVAFLFAVASATHVAAQQWEVVPTAHAPAAHRSTAMAFDEVGRRAVLFGGLGGFAGRTCFGETWQLDSGTWSELVPMTVPPARSGNAMVYDMARRRIVMFGGSDATSVDLADTWEWDGSDWERMRPRHAPPARHDHAMAFDPVRGTVVLFAGEAGNFAPRALDDTWEWDGRDWTRLRPQHTPPLRASHALATDWARGEVVLFGGHNSKNLRDTWTWDGSDWRVRTGELTPPASPRCAAAFSALRGRVVVAAENAADSWEWDGRRWWRVETRLPAGAPASMAGSVQWGDVIGFGGAANATGHYRAARAGLAHAGIGCGSPAPEIEASAPASLGAVFSGTVTGCAAEFALVVFGLAAPATGPIPLGSPRGASTCALEIEPSAAWFQHVAVANGTAFWGLPIPAQPARLGLEIHVQAFAGAPAGSGLGGWIGTGLCVASVF